MMTQDKRLTGGIAAAVLAAAIGGFSVAKCTTSSPPTETTKSTSSEEKAAAPADSIAMTPEAITNAAILTETVQPGGLGAEIVSQATVTAAPMGEAVVTARVGGAVTRIFKRLGDPVSAGEALAVVTSRDAAQIVADRTAAAAKATLARKNLARERYLYDEKVSARVDYEQAQAEAAAATAEARRAQVAAGAANVTRDGTGVIVASPISGRVTAENVSLGAFVQPETELFRVADPNQIQIEAAILPSDAARVPCCFSFASSSATSVSRSARSVSSFAPSLVRASRVVASVAVVARIWSCTFASASRSVPSASMRPMRERWK